MKVCVWKGGGREQLRIHLLRTKIKNDGLMITMTLARTNLLLSVSQSSSWNSSWRFSIYSTALSSP